MFSASQRLFLALWPDETTRGHIAQLSLEFDAWGGRIVPAENLHITLAFVGDTSKVQADALCARLDVIDLPGFQLTIDYLSHWAQPQVLWLGTESPPPAASELQTVISECVHDIGLPTDKRPWTPHITLRRKVKSGPRKQPIEPFDWAIDKFVLVKSEFTQNDGVQYSVLKTWPLSPPPTNGG